MDKLAELFRERIAAECEPTPEEIRKNLRLTLFERIRHGLQVLGATEEEAREITQRQRDRIMSLSNNELRMELAG